MTKKIGVVAVALMASAGLAACGSSGGSSGSGGSGGGHESVVFSSPTNAQEGQHNISVGFEAGAKSLGWSTSVVDANLSADKQVSDIATMVTQKKNAIASWTLDPGAAAGAYGQAQSAGIPVIGINSTGTGVSATVWWELNTCGTNSPIERSAEYIARIRPHASVIVIGGPPVPSIQAYVRCFRAAAARHGLNIINETDNTRDTAANAQSIAQDLLTKNPNVDAFWNYNDASALGVSAAITSANKKVYTGSGAGIIDIGQNGDSDAIAAIRDGRLTATWDTDSVATGWAVIRLMSDYIGANRMSNPPRQLVVRSDFWTRDNIDRYVAPNARRFTLDNLPLVNAAPGS